MTLQIDRDAAEILNCSARAVKAILARRRQLDLDGRAGETLVVLAGECHTMPAHLIHHIKTMQGVIGAGLTLSAAWETDHNILSQCFFSETGRAPDAALSAAILKKDADGTLALKIHMHTDSSGASHARRALVHYLLNDGITTVCNDAAHDDDCTLDPRDPGTARSIRACYGDAKSRDLANDIEWMMPGETIHIRNHHMAERASAYIESAKPRILYQMCGNAHVCGFDALGCAPEESLSACFRKKGMPVLAMPVGTVSPDWNASKKHRLRPEEIFTVRGPGRL
jgi:hypothetical protein